jgi:hypothetical protein
MANTKDKKLYRRLRSSGVRKKVARDLTALPGEVKNGRAPKRLREAVDRLDAGVSELRSHLGSSDRRAAGKKAAQTRRAKAKKRSAAARKGARKRAKA